MNRLTTALIQTQTYLNRNCFWCHFKADWSFWGTLPAELQINYRLLQEQEETQWNVGRWEWHRGFSQDSERKSEWALLRWAATLWQNMIAIHFSSFTEHSSASPLLFVVFLPSESSTRKIFDRETPCFMKFAVEVQRWLLFVQRNGRTGRQLLLGEGVVRLCVACRRRLSGHRGLLCDMKSRTLRMPLRRSFREVRARNGSWARPSKGRTASSHQHQEGPLGLACRDNRDRATPGETISLIFILKGLFYWLV